MNQLATYIDAIRSAPMWREVGHVRKITGLSIEADGPEVGVGALCRIQKKGAAGRRDTAVPSLTTRPALTRSVARGRCG